MQACTVPAPPDFLPFIKKLIAQDAPPYWGGQSIPVPADELRSADVCLVSTVQRIVSRDAPRYRGRPPTPEQIAQMRRDDLEDLIGLCLAEEALRNPGPPGRCTLEKDICCLSRAALKHLF